MEENGPEDNRQSCPPPAGDMAENDGHTSDEILSLTNQASGSDLQSKLPFSFLVCKYSINESAHVTIMKQFHTLFN